VPGQTTDPAHFRQKVAFVFTEGAGGRLELGHYARGARNAVPVDMCPVHSVRGNTVAFALRDRLRAAGLRASGPGGVLRHLIVRVSADEREAVAMLVVSENVKALRGPVRALMDSTDAPEGFFININDRPGPYMVGAETIRVAGASHIREDVGGIGYLVSPTAFFQTNVAAAAVLQRHVVDTMAGAARVLDLYCGSGLFSLPLARAGVRVTGIEENRQAIADAGRNARLNSVDEGQARFLALRVEDAVDRMARERWDGVILDPPRQGCSDEVLEAVFQRLAPPRVTYVSCGPDSLAVELPGILQCGYRIESLRAVDMFPHTDHVEAVLTLTRAADARTSRAASSPRR
jgi:23S rRNA (uracil1939-C5)-methyltransferase